VDGGFFRVPGVTDIIHITCSDTNATTPANAALVNGTGQFTVTMATVGNQTITATDVTNTNIPPATSAAIQVIP
jgi:hypothetical protein